MPRKAKDIIPREPEPRLFDFPEEPHLVDAVKRYRHTGTTALKDEPRVAMAVELMLAGVGLERVAERVRAAFGTGFGVHTLRAFRDALDEGNLAGWKERVVAKSKRLLERGLDSLADDLESGALEPGQKPVMLGILADKIAGWEGAPGMVPLNFGQLVLNVDQVNVILAGQAPPEIDSGAPAAISAPIDVSATVGPCSGPCPGAVPTAEAKAEGGGGGGVYAPPSADPDVSASGELRAKDFPQP